MKFTREHGIYLAAALAIAVAIVVGIAIAKQNQDPYRGLTTHIEVQMDAPTRTLIEQRLATTKAAIEAAKQSGTEVDLNLYLSLGGDALLLGDLIAAREAYEAQLAGNSLNHVAWNNYGYTLNLMGDNDKALEAYERAVEIDAYEKYYQDAIAFIEEHYPDRSAKVEELYQDSVRRLGQQSWNMLGLGRWYAGHNDCTRSEEHYDVAESLAANADTKQQVRLEAESALQTCKQGRAVQS